LMHTNAHVPLPDDRPRSNSCGPGPTLHCRNNFPRPFLRVDPHQSFVRPKG
jgi:hypothetical protein